MKTCLLSEVRFRTARSSGPGGQHVNKTESKVVLIWNPSQSQCLNQPQKQLLLARIGNKLSEDGSLILSSEKHRSQHQNRQEVVERLFILVASSLVPPKKRIPTKPSRASVERRITQKKRRGDIKRSRRLPPDM